ncbi:hypothetical protein [Candidatus Amarolinea aalborgensis]|uniref:hypothetical protein n=1 Tax=Candidatus Amarolinea aalborgensis TaxID=2249329 RepID=UPI003BF97E85
MRRWTFQRAGNFGIEALLLAGIITMAAFLRFWQLHSTPPGYHFDEAFEGLEAWRLLQDPTYRPLFFTGNFGVEPLFIYLTAIAFKLFGAGPVVQRGVAALIGLLTVPAVWLLAHELRRWQPRLPASFPLWSAAVQAGLFWAISASRIGYEPGLVPLLLCPLLWALLAALRTGRPAAWVAAGALTGLGPYTYPAGRLYPVVVAAVLLIAWLWPRLLPRASADGVAAAALRPRCLLLLALSALLVFAPLAWQWVSNPDLVLLRSRQIAVVAEGAGSTSPLQTIVQHTLATAGMFSLAGDVDPRNNLPGRPVFDWFLAPFFYLGLALTLWRWRERTAAWLLAVLAIMLAPTILSEYAPHFRRALGALPIVALLTGLGLGAAWDWAARRPLPAPEQPVWRRPACWLRMAISACLLVSIGLAGRDYFDRWARSPDLFYAFDEGLWQLAQGVTELPAASQVYLTPRPATHTTLAFAWRSDQPPSTFDGRHIFVIPPDAQRRRFYAVIEAEDYRSRLLLPELFPAVVMHSVVNDRAGQRYAAIYEAPIGVQPIIQPQIASDAVWNAQARLLGFNLNSVYRRGDIIYLRLFWRALAPIAEDWTFFVHVLDAAGQNRLGADAAPGAGSYPTTRWQMGEWIIDEIQIALPVTLASGDYQLEAGFYLSSGARIPVTAAADFGDHLLLARLRIEEAP